MTDTKITVEEALTALQAWAEWHYQTFGDTSTVGPIAETADILSRRHVACRQAASPYRKAADPVLDAELRLMRATVNALLDRGYYITVNDGEYNVVNGSRDAEEVLAAMRASDEDFLMVRSVNNPSLDFFGWVRFIYGNDGCDVINDYTLNLESVLAPVNALADRIEKEIYPQGR